jgi:hypothetical protein
MIQLELNDIGCKLIFYGYSKFASNAWYTLICKFEKYKKTPKNYMGMNIYGLLDFIYFYNWGNFLKMRNKGNRKKKSSLEFWRPKRMGK